MDKAGTLNEFSMQIDNILTNTDRKDGAGVILIGELENKNFKGSILVNGTGVEMVATITQLCSRALKDSPEIVKKAFIISLSKALGVEQWTQI